MYFWADRVLKILENMDLDSVFKEAEAENHMVHGDYNYHNLLVCQEGMAVTGFEHAHRDVQMEDHQFVLPLRKGMDSCKKCRKTFTFCRTDRRKKAVFAESVCVSDIAFGFLRF